MGRNKSRVGRANFIQAWRKHRKMTQRQVCEQLEFMLADRELDADTRRKMPTTTASLSRIEGGEQPYSQGVLEALAEVYGVEPGWLLDRDPNKDGKVVDLMSRAPADQLRQLERVIEAFLEAGSNR